MDARVTRASGHAERVAALAMIEARSDRPRAVTLGADRGYDAEDFANELRSMNVRPHVAQNLARRGGSAIDGRTTQHRGYDTSQRTQKRIEEGFCWTKTIAGLDRPMVRGLDRVGWAFTCRAKKAILSRSRWPTHRLSPLLHVIACHAQA